MKPPVARIVTRLLTSHTLRDIGRFRAALPRRLRGTVPVIDYFHQVDDPYSDLSAQILTRLQQRYGVDIRIWLAPPPEDSAAPERARLQAYARRDAVRVAAEYGVSFPNAPRTPSPRDIEAATQILAEARSDLVRFVTAVGALGEVLWGDGTGAELPSDQAPMGRAEVARRLAEGGARRAKLGHYLSAMFHFEGEWYWSLDRLHHLEARLAAMGRDSTPEAAPIAPYRDIALKPLAPSDKPAPVIEAWFSFRSPYSWIAFPRLRRLASHHGAELRLRFILPMVMRGLPVPRVKTLYITRDTKREADQVGLPFGTIVDPVGSGAARALAVLHHAVALGRGETFAELAMRGAFAEGIALAEDEGLFDVAKRAGLTEAETRAALADESWRTVAEENRAALFEAGLWGAPSYRVNGGAAHWGQDRLWALEADLIATQT